MLGLSLKSCIPAFAALLLAGCKPPEESLQQAIIGAVLIDGAGGPPVSDSVVIVAGSRIRAIGNRANTPIPVGVEKVDGRGKFLVPGLIDLHVHLGTRAGARYDTADYTRERIERNLNAYLYFGVTAVRSVGLDRQAGFDVRKAEREGRLLTARMFTAGRGFTAPGGHPSQEVGDVVIQTNSPEEARKQVDTLAAQQVDAIKIWVDDLGHKAPKIKPAVIDAILDQARKYNIPVTAHIYSLADTEYLVRAGAAGFLHMIQDTEDIDPAFIARLRDLRIVFAPTLVRQELDWLYTEHPNLLDDPDVARSVDADVDCGGQAGCARRPCDAGRARGLRTRYAQYPEAGSGRSLDRGGVGRRLGAGFSGVDDASGIGTPGRGRSVSNGCNRSRYQKRRPGFAEG